MAPSVLVEGAAPRRSSTCVSALGGGVLGCWAVAWCSPTPQLRGSAPLPGGTGVQMRWDVWFFGCFFKSFCSHLSTCLSRGGSRKEKKTEQHPKNTAGQEAFLEMTNIRNFLMKSLGLSCPSGVGAGRR